MNADLLTQLSTKLDEPTARHTALDAQYAGRGPLSFLAPEIRAGLDGRLERVSVNVPRTLVDALVERLTIAGFTGTKDDAGLWADWRHNDLDQQAPVCHREAFVLGTAYATVWAHADGTPNVSIESARQVAHLVDPGTRETIAAVKRWETKTTTEAVLYQPEQITLLRAQSTGATITGFEVVSELPNPLGMVPVVPFVNGGRLLTPGVSEMVDVIPLSDAVTKITTDMLTASEFGARPRRWASGVELVEQPVLDANGDETGGTEAVSPFAEDDRMLLSEDPAARFGSLPGSDLAGYEKAVGVLMRQISCVSGLPEHLLGVSGSNPTSADAIRAAESALTARAVARQAAFGRSWEQVARLMVAVRHGIDPHTVEPVIAWADPATRSAGEEADAVAKLVQAGVLTVAEARQRLGMTTEQAGLPAPITSSTETEGTAS